MSQYTVEWTSEAEDNLADVWLRAPNPSAVTAAQAEIDRRLARDPIGNGVHLSEGLYRLRITPLAVTYTVDQTQHNVEVESVWYAP